jgi:hypothetical protein
MSNRIDDGFPTTVNIYDDEGMDSLTDTNGQPITAVQFWEKSITPPGVQGGGANDTSTMRNTRWRTMNSKKLLTLSEASLTVAYDPELYESILELIQVNKYFVINWPDRSKLGFYGWLDEFTPGEVSEGGQPEADIKIIPSNQNNASPPAEIAPNYTDAA